MAVGTVLLLALIYMWAIPGRTRWRSHLPGAALTMGLWVGGSWALRYALGRMFNSVSLFGPLSAPIALLMWLYLCSLAALVGAAFNAALASLWPAWSQLPGHGRPRGEDEPQPLEDASQPWSSLRGA